MRVVALEEHFIVPSLLERISPDAVEQRGFPARGKPWSPLNATDEMADLGPARLKVMDESAVPVRFFPLLAPAPNCCRLTRARPGHARPTTL